MKSASRSMALLFVVPATYYLIYWLPVSFVPLGEETWLARAVFLICAVAVGWFVWAKLASAHQGVISSILLGAILLGGLGFAVGFFGPIIFTPEANQGPLLGIFFTGPLGFVVGGIAGFFYRVIYAGKHQRKKAKANDI